MSDDDAPRDDPPSAPRHLAARPPRTGAFGPPLDPPVFLSEDDVLTGPDAGSATDGATTTATNGNGNGQGNGHDPTGSEGGVATLPAPDADPAEPADPVDPADSEERRRFALTLTNLVDLGVVLACALFVFLQMGPSNIFADTTPAGGDMGAHVWGPAYLRDHLLPQLQVAGWSPDWYAGFPVYQFYMVVPALLIVLLDVGIEGPFALLPLAVAGVCGWFAYRSWHEVPRRRRNLFLAGAVLALCCIGFPYGVAFKLVSISGAVTLPAAAYAFGRLSGLRFPTPALFSVASLVFLFYRGFTIYGGNLPSTLAGEFAFSMSLSIGLLYLGVLFRGLSTGKHRGLAAVLLALTGLCHLIPAFWVLGATAVAVVVWPRRATGPDDVRIAGPLMARLGRPEVGRRCAILAAAGGAICLLAVHWELNVGLPWPFGNRIGRLDGVAWGPHLELPLPGGSRDLPLPVWVGGAMVMVALVLWVLPSLSLRFVLPSLVVGGLLSAWWVLPFQMRGLYVNDMGWEKIPIPDQNPPQTWTRYLLPPDVPDTPGSDLRWVFAIALVGVGISLASRLRMGIFLTVCAGMLGFAFWLLPDGRLWNARLLPFYYLTVMLLAALAVAELVRLVVEFVRAGRMETDPVRAVAPGIGTALSGLVVILIVVGLPLGVLPWKEDIVKADGGTGYAWPSFSPLQVESAPGSYVPGWADWNYSGYEGKPAYREYYEITQTMARLGERDGGCGRAMWEYEAELDRYGTPMALMLLPYWTDGCIGSMEGLYFEASSTTPWHFLMQDELSEACSCAQRDMPYGRFNINRGVQHMQLLGVKYYMATSDLAVQAASGHPDLTKVAESGPWVVFEVANAPLVQPLVNEPVVVADNSGSQHDWMEEPRDAGFRNDGVATRWYMHPELWDVMVSLGGPDDWERVDSDEVVPGQPLDANAIVPAEVTDVEVGREAIEFDVDRIGVPVLVKASYFPNWNVSGAEGPWRVAPNLMVVVPTEEHVTLRFERTSVEWFAYLVTALGIVGLIVLVRRGTYRFGEE